MEAKGIRLLTSVRASITYMGFNMQDPVVGGDSERARLLRRALAIAIDFDEYISIFANGRGVVAQSPLAPGIFGVRDGEAGIDPYVFQWQDDLPGAASSLPPPASRDAGPSLGGAGAPGIPPVPGGRAVRRPLEEAKALLAQAGWPDGRDQASGQTLTLYFDTAAGGPRRQVQAQLDAQAVRQARHRAGHPLHGLQPLPGQDAQGDGADLPMGLERRLPGSGELPVPALRPQWQGQGGWGERRQLCQPGVRCALRADAQHGQRPASARR